MKNIPLNPVKSSNISGIGYDAPKRILAVKFKSGGHYAYHNVTAADHAALMGAPSIGSHLSANIVPRFKSERL